jgi:hypothetical protein
MRSHAVHVKANQCTFLSAPVERGVEMTLGLPPTHLCTRHVEEEMRSGKGHEQVAIAELMSDAHNSCSSM